MPEYVYALHDFIPEHEDEISFRAGERIEVVEKDDLYGDGWWQVSRRTSNPNVPRLLALLVNRRERGCESDARGFCCALL